jgi:hypothetical protein
MKLNRALLAVAIAVCGLMAGAVPAGATAAPSCGIGWGSLDSSGGSLGVAPLITTRTGQHECFDRLVFELDGPATGYRVNYGEAYTGGQGLALSPYTAGGAVLNVVLLSPTAGGSGPVRYDYRTGDHPGSVLGYRTLRDVVFGGSYEGYTTFAVGVRARLPYQVTVLPGPGTHSRIVLDVAHSW